MRKHRKVLLVAFCLAALLATLAILRREPEPRYRDRPLSYWTYLYTASERGWPQPEAPQTSARQDEALQAVRAIGPSAVPHLVKWIGYQPSPLKAKLIALTRMLLRGPWSRWLPSPNVADQAWLRAVSASDAFKILGPAAAFAAPDLLRLAHRSRNPAGAQAIVQALASLGPQGILALGEILTNAPAPSASEADAHARYQAISQLTDMGTNALPAIPALAKCLADDDVQVATLATLALRTIVFTVASESLADLGGRPRQVTPSLVALLNATNPQVREATTNAILEIAPEVLTNAAAR